MTEAAVQQQMKKCPACAELILAEALKCKHCGEWLKEQANAEPVTPAAADEQRYTSVLRTLTAFGVAALPGCWVFGMLLLGGALHADGHRASDALGELALKALVVGGFASLIVAHVFGVPLGFILRRVRQRGRPTRVPVAVFCAVTTLGLAWMMSTVMERAISPAYLKASAPFFWIALFTSVCGTAVATRFSTRPSETLLVRAKTPSPRRRAAVKIAVATIALLVAYCVANTRYVSAQHERCHAQTKVEADRYFKSCLKECEPDWRTTYSACRWECNKRSNEIEYACTHAALRRTPFFCIERGWGDWAC